MAQLSLTCPSSSVASSGISLETHETIDSLVHMLSEDAFGDIVRDAQGQVTDFNVSTSVGGTDIRTTEVTRNAQGQVIEVVENQHDGGGAIIQTLTTTITRSGGQVVSITTDET